MEYDMRQEANSTKPEIEPRSRRPQNRKPDQQPQRAAARQRWSAPMETNPANHANEAFEE